MTAFFEQAELVQTLAGVALCLVLPLLVVTALGITALLLRSRERPRPHEKDASRPPVTPLTELRWELPEGWPPIDEPAAWTARRV